MSTEEQKAERREDARYYYQRAKRLHKCCVCGGDAKPKPGGGYYVYCEACLVKKRVAGRDFRGKCMANHKCCVCGLPVDINPKTGKPYSRCPACAKGHREYQREYARRAQK